jgi:hypothetical protein
MTELGGESSSNCVQWFESSEADYQSHHPTLPTSKTQLPKLTVPTSFSLDINGYVDLPF